MQSASINLSAVADGQNENEKLSILDRVDDPEVSITNAIKVLFSSQFCNAGRSRFS
jgi:hypothetical protein